VADRSYTDSDLDAAILAIGEPGRLQEAQSVVTRAAPSLQRVLDEALHEGGWFGQAHLQAVREAAGTEDPAERTRAVQTLIAEETRLGMFVGVAVGFELARELQGDAGDSVPPGEGNPNQTTQENQ
jgi:hypothetical protein